VRLGGGASGGVWDGEAKEGQARRPTLQQLEDLGTYYAAGGLAGTMLHWGLREDRAYLRQITPSPQKGQRAFFSRPLIRGDGSSGSGGSSMAASCNIDGGGALVGAATAIYQVVVATRRAAAAVTPREKSAPVPWPT
jgi:hypothetical protein